MRTRSSSHTRWFALGQVLGRVNLYAALAIVSVAGGAGVVLFDSWPPGGPVHPMAGALIIGVAPSGTPS